MSTNAYLNLSDIVASEKVVHCRVDGGVPTYMFDAACTVPTTTTAASQLEESLQEESMNSTLRSDAGSTLGSMPLACHMPLWLATHLHASGRVLKRRNGVLAAGEYLTKTTSALAINPSIGDLYKYGPHYYTVGVQLLRVNATPQTGNIAQALLHMYRQRCMWIMPQAYHGEEAPAILDASETILHAVGRASRNAQQTFNVGQARTIRRHECNTGSRKRPRGAF